jgi:hypothetical protein
MLVPALPVPRLTVELVRALNDWTVDRWLAEDPSLLGTILVPTQLPDLAAAEIRRVGGHERMVAVLLGANGLAKPFGHPVYHPIYEAAEELGLSIAAGGDQSLETASYPAAGGLPNTHSEFRTLAGQALMTHTASLFAQGVVDRWPSLDFLLLGGSVVWVTPFLWRLDNLFKAFRQDMLWLEERPSELFCRRFLVGTDPFRWGVDPEKLRAYLETDHSLGDVVCYASGYPELEYSSPGEIEAALPDEWATRVFQENPRRFLQSGVAPSPSSTPRGRSPE